MIPAATIAAYHLASGLTRTGETDALGNYQIAALPVGLYRLDVRRTGFRSTVVNDFRLEVARITVQNFRLEVGDVSEQVVVTSAPPLIEVETVSVGKVIDQRTVQELPLNGPLLMVRE